MLEFEETFKSLQNHAKKVYDKEIKDWFEVLILLFERRDENFELIESSDENLSQFLKFSISKFDSKTNEELISNGVEIICESVDFSTDYEDFKDWYKQGLTFTDEDPDSALKLYVDFFSQ